MKHLINWALLFAVCASLSAFCAAELSVAAVFLILALGAASLLLRFDERRKRFAGPFSAAASLVLGAAEILGLRGVSMGIPFVLYGTTSPAVFGVSAAVLPLAGFAAKLPLPGILAGIALSGLSFVLTRIAVDSESLRTRHFAYVDESTAQTAALRRERRALIDREELVRENTRLAERNRIAREIHDNVGHKLTGAILQAAALETIADDAMKPPLETLHSTLSDAMEQIRQSVHGMHERSLSLPAALDRMAEEYAFCPVKVRADLSQEPPVALYYTVLAVCREALANTARHSDATRVDITVNENGRSLHLLIADNGSGAEQSSDASGIGLLSLEERVMSQGGQFTVNRENGFRIFVRLPLTPEERNEL